MSRVDAAQVRALVAAYRSADERRSALALATESYWAGPDVLDTPSKAIRVVPCPSPLAVRAALVDHDDSPEEILVILTPCRGADLGLDVRARLMKGDVLPPDPYASVLGLFRATVLDPQLAAERWLIDDLIALAPAGGWPERQPLGGALDIETAWTTWHEARLGLPDAPISVADVLASAARPAVAAGLAGLTPEQRQTVADRWSGGIAGPIPVLADLIAGGQAGQLVPLGLVAQVLWATTAYPALAALQSVARARLEPLLGRDRLDSAGAAAWASAASATLDRDSLGPALLEDAERALAEAGASDLAVLSDSLPLGFEQRLAAFGRALHAKDENTAGEALDGIQRHRHAARRSHRVETAEAALKVLRRSQLPRPGVPTTFPAAAAGYVSDGAWLDEARRLLAEGDHVPELASAYTALAEAATSEQADTSRQFATLLADWSAAEPLPDQRVVPIERILDEIVTPAAQASPVLLVVCDGLGLPVTHILVRDLLQEGWGPAAPDGRDSWPVGVATLPTVTEVSRTCLLAGKRTIGGQPEERSGFESHPGLRAASQATRPPVLVHKAGLVGPNGVALPDEVRRLVADPDQRVVGVVVNAVDDHLARGDQVRVGWDLVSLRPLPWLLDAAAEAGRLVIITADHGHVLQGPGSTVRQLPGGGERWRPTGPPAGDGEVEVAGPRVLMGGGRVILPADDRLRYGGYKHGYHGGATPEEVLVPVEVLARRLPTGWSHRPVVAPVWWSGEPAAPDRPRSQPASAPTAAKVTVPTLFDQPTTPSEAGVAPEQPGGGPWVEALLNAPAFAAHRQSARLPRPLPDARLRAYLDVIDANGGSIPFSALAARTGEPPDTLRMALTLVQRLLNLDGAEVLTVVDGTVLLNRELAELQFEIVAP